LKKILEKVRSWTEDQLQNLKPGDQFPTDRQIAAALNVSIGTVMKVTRDLAGQGKLERTRGRGTIVAGQDTPTPPLPQANQTSPQAIADAIYQSICSGDIQHGQALPQVKYMSYRFKVTERTVTEGYRELVKRGWVTRVGKTFWVGRLSDLVYLGKKKQVYLFIRDSDDFSPLFQKDVFSLAFQRMEQELLAYGYLLRYENSAKFSQLVTDWIAHDDIPAGLIFTYTTNSWFSQLLPDIRKLQAVPDRDRPAILLEWGAGMYNLRLPDTKVHSRGYVLTSAARALGLYLQRKNYREVALFVNEGILREFWTIDPGIKCRVTIRPVKPQAAYRERLKNKVIPTEIAAVVETEKGRTRIPYEDLTQEVTITREFSTQFRKLTYIPLWVFSQSSQAVRALNWAEKKGVKVPEDISIISLENYPRYLHHGLTFCGPDWDNIGYLMAHAIINDFPVEKTRQGFIRTRARVVEKLTTI
jgi:DNA-binding transcriptional regulator YhcF (GntR family)